MEYLNTIKERRIPINSTILQALKKMDAVNKKMLLVFDTDKFIGILSIGDIQKAIITNISLETCISKIMRKDFVYAKISDEKDTIFQLMQKLRIECMPVLNENNELISIYLWDDVFVTKKRNEGIQLNLPVIIMAGGQGTRLKPLTTILPKPLIPIGEKTIIEQIMDKFCDVGCNTFYLSVNYKAEMIKYYFSTLQNMPYNISYFQEDKPLGTIGSLSLLKGKLNSTFFVSNCDILVDQDIKAILDFHRDNKNEITIVAALKHYPIPYGIMETNEDGSLKSISEKPELTFKINTGLYILEPHLLNEIPEDKFYDITDQIMDIMKRKGKIGVFPVSEKSWVDIGSFADYFKTIQL